MCRHFHIFSQRTLTFSHFTVKYCWSEALLEDAMIFCFNCTVETKEELDRLLAIGSYRDYGEAIAAAIRNQLLMEQEVAEKGVIIIGEPPTAAPESRKTAQTVQSPKVASAPKATTRQPRPSPPQKETSPAKTSRNGSAPAPKTATPASVPALFKNEGLPEQPPSGLAELPGDMFAPGQVVPLDRWVLGQENRLLPAKVNARALVRLFLENPKGLPISETAERIAASAAALGDYLSALDETRKAPRDDALATAFPTTAEDAEKGRARYANQFVVYQNSRGELSGLMVDLKLINIAPQRKERLIVPTRVAWEFARLPNPVLDRGLDSQVEKFTPEERSLIMRHIASSVPVEAFAYRAILEAVRDGHNSPDTIDAALKIYVPAERAEKFSQSFLASQRSGAVSRMSDLGLIERQREGVRVYYTATDEGLAFLNESTSHHAR
jgi:hypothetical protein